MWLVGDARQHRARQHGLAHHRLAGGDRRERARGRNAQRRHRLADDVFAQHRAQRRAAVAAARERRGARALELDVAPHARAIDHLAQQDGAAIAELRHEVAELVAGIGERDRLGTDRRCGCRPGSRRPAASPAGRGRGRARAASASLSLDQARRRDRRRIEPGVEALGQPRIAVVEGEGGLASRWRRFAQEGQTRVVRHAQIPSRRSSRSSCRSCGRRPA